MRVCWCTLAGTRACINCSNGSGNLTYPFDYKFWKDSIKYEFHYNTSTSTNIKSNTEKFKKKYNTSTSNIRVYGLDL